MRSKRYRIAQIGTFDLKNYGDLLFPDVLATELPKYLNIEEIVLFSPIGGKKPFDSREVLPISMLEKEHQRKPFDAVICGGGDIIRLDHQLVSHTEKYELSNTAADLWVEPILIANRYDIPLLFHCPGVPFAFGDKERELVQVLFQQIDYVSVRDKTSAAILKNCLGVDVRIVPDSVFLIEQTYSYEELNEIFVELKKKFDLPKKYFLFQLNRKEPELTDANYEEYIAAIEAWTAAECLLMPIGYVHQDKEILTELNESFSRKRRLIECELSPKEMLAIILHGQCFVGTSMHGCLTSLVLGNGAVAINPGCLTKIRGLFSLMDLDQCEVSSIRNINSECFTKKLSEEVKEEIKKKVNVHIQEMAYVIQEGKHESGKQIELLRSFVNIHMQNNNSSAPLFSVVYFDSGEGYCEQNCKVYPFIEKKRIDIEVYIPAGIKKVRFDPVEAHCVVISNLSICCGNEEILDVCREMDRYIAFDTTDPQIEFDVVEREKLHITCDVELVSEDEARRYKALVEENKKMKDLAKENQELQNRERMVTLGLEELTKQVLTVIDGYKDGNSALIQLNKELREKDAQIKALGDELNRELKSENLEVKAQNAALVRENSEVKKQNVALVRENSEVKKQNTALASENEEVKAQNIALMNENIRIKDENSILLLKNSGLREVNSQTAELCEKTRNDNIEKDKQIQLLSENLVSLRTQNEELLRSYNSISSSDIWRITAPLRRTLDALKNRADKMKWSRLMLKGARHFKRYGFKSTVAQVRRYAAQKSEKTVLSEMNIVNDNGYFEENQDFSAYKTDIKTLALYLPQYHEIPENNEWWGKGFTEWTNVKKGRKRFENHNQPRVPSDDIGYYDLSYVDNLKKQVRLAKQHGIYGFAVYYYWFSGKRLLEKPLDIFLDHKEIEFPFMAVWANENWTRTWDGKEKSILIEQKYAKEDARQFILDIKKYIDDSRYIRVDGKPVIGLYAPYAIPDVENVLEGWRQTAREVGMGEILIWVCAGDCNAQIMGIEDFVDGEYEFPPRGKGYVPHCEVPSDGTAYDYSMLVESERNFDVTNRKIPVYRGSMMQWDNSARKERNYHCWINFSPEQFYIWNRINVKYLREKLPPEHRFMFINAWNEWGEGTYLEPDQRYGYACINALSKALMDIPYYDEKQIQEKKSQGIDTVEYLGGGLGSYVEDDWDKELKSKCRIAIQAHVFYPELMGEINQHLSYLPYPYDLYVTTTDEQKAKKIKLYLKKHSNSRKFRVFVYENKGRDVVPFLYQMKPVIDKYKYFCHIHTKKSLHTSNLGDIWREYLYENLLGSTTIIKEILYRFESRKDIGVVFPDNLDVVRPWVEWGSNREIAENLVKRMEMSIQFPDDIMFPAGNMFWARTDAVKNIFKVDYKDEDFPSEGAQVDGTLMHAIERSWLYVAQANGYRYQLTRSLTDNRPLDLLR